MAKQTTTAVYMPSDKKKGRAKKKHNKHKSKKPNVGQG